MDKISSMKQQYNTVLARIRNGECYLDDSNIPLPERETHMPSFVALTRQAGAALQELRLLGIDYTPEEFESGFKIEEESECQILHV